MNIIIYKYKAHKKQNNINHSMNIILFNILVLDVLRSNFSRPSSLVCLLFGVENEINYLSFGAEDEAVVEESPLCHFDCSEAKWRNLCEANDKNKSFSTSLEMTQARREKNIRQSVRFHLE